MTTFRITFRMLWLGLLFLIVVGAISALAANNTVAPSRASSQSFTVDANSLKPVECAGITVGGFSWEVKGKDSGLYFGTADNDTIDTGNGDDCVLAGDGNDTVYGKSGTDVLLGEGGADRLYGGAGDDWLYGGDGIDTCYGGNGTNNFSGCEVCHDGASDKKSITCP